MMKTMISPIILGCSFLLLLVQSCLGLSSSSSSSSSSPSTSTTSSSFATVELASTRASQLAIVDGGEWSTMQVLLKQEGALPKRMASKRGYMTIVTGLADDGQRVIGMQQQQQDKSTVVFEDSMAPIPSQVSDGDAIATYISALSAIHCALPPKVQSIGGSTDSAMIDGGKAIVLGSNRLACFAAEGLASLGVEVSLVSTGNPKANTKVGKLQILKPAVGEEEIGFSSYVGEFDSLVDTISNEFKGNNFMTMMSQDDDDDDDDDFDLASGPFGSSILGLLKSRHNCQRYISTETESQKIVAKEGIFGGPGKADKYCQTVASSLKQNDDCVAIPPPQEIGRSMTTLLEKGILFSQAERKKLCAKSDVVRGWSLGDFWENTRWPRDASGMSDVRFGLPVISDDDEDDDDDAEETTDEIISRLGRSEAGPSNFERLASRRLPDPVGEAPLPTQHNPHVFQINSVSGLNNAIVSTKKNSVLFLSAKFCQTCKRMDPKYTRLARVEKENNDSSVLFAKAEMGSSWGKQLGRHLGVDAVPAFLLFRDGRRFGPALSISDLPSDKIEKALDLLESGNEWDPQISK